jgi:hypothetical protein
VGTVSLYVLFEDQSVSGSPKRRTCLDCKLIVVLAIPHMYAGTVVTIQFCTSRVC